MGKFSDASKRTPSHSSPTFENDDVYVAESSYVKEKHQRCLGLFANRNFDEGEIIQEYIGKHITKEESDNKTKSTMYMFEVKVNGRVDKIIDGANARTTSAARYANTVLKNDDPMKNSDFVQYRGRIYLKAVKKILKSQEIITYYGKNTQDIINAK
jgi:SET domain-containing protein